MRTYHIHLLMYLDVRVAWSGLPLRLSHFSNRKKGDTIMTNVYLLDVNGNPLMPCHNGGFIRKLLKQGKAKVVRSCPFTIQLSYEVRNKHKQNISLGVDSGYT